MSTDTKLKGHELFGKLCVEEVNRLDVFSHVKEYDAGDTIFEFNEVCSHIYMLMEGDVYLVLPAKPAEYSFAFAEIHTNEIFGLSPLLDQPRYTAQGKCKTKSKILLIEAEPFKEMMLHNPDAGLYVSNQVARIYYLRYLDNLRKLQHIVGQVSIVK